MQHFFLGLMAISTLTATVAADDAAARFAAQVQVRYEIVANGLRTECPAAFGGDTCFKAQLSFASPADSALEPGWQFYFSHVEPIRATDGDAFRLTAINGDLYRLEAGAGFRGVKSGARNQITLWGAGSQLSRFYVMPNWYLVAADGTAHLIQTTVPGIDPETGLETLPHVAAFADPARQFKRIPGDGTARPTAAWLYDHYGDLPAAAARTSLVPQPQSVRPGDGTLDIRRGFMLETELPLETVTAALRQLAAFGLTQRTDGIPLRLAMTADAGAEAGSYTLAIAADGIRVTGTDGEGVQNGLMSLAGLLVPGDASLPFVEIKDSPRYGFRGVHLDIARNFNSKAFILALLDQMAAYKLNKLTLQLSDDEGWRVEIAGLPELTDIGARRCHDLKEDRCLLPQLGSGPTGQGVSDGFLSADDYVDIVAAARARHIEVIPFFDMPGHSRAAVRAMEARYRRLMAAGDRAGAEAYRLVDPDDHTAYESIQHYHDNTLNVCLPSAYAFVGKLVDEMAALHTRAGQPLRTFHLGADETPGAWRQSPACARLIAATPGLTAEDLGAHFIETVAGMLADRGITAAGWGDGFADTDAAHMPADTMAFAWAPIFGGAAENAHTLANRGWGLVISTPDALYLDAPYIADPEERGYDWASRHTDTRKIFELMPDNLPAHAEIWEDASGHAPMVADTVPLKAGHKAIGLQAELWSETVRTDAQAAYMLFPRLLAVAERAWHRPDWEVPYKPGQAYGRETHFLNAARLSAREADWQRFAALVGSRELAKLDTAALPYRLPPVGAVMRDGRLWCRLPFPGLGIEVRQPGGDWQPYEAGVAVAGPVDVRARSTDGRRVGRSLTVEEQQEARGNGS